MGRRPEVLRIGANTQGVFSDVLLRKLPNGWVFGLPNEQFLTEDGITYDGPGIPPHIPVPVFPETDLEAGRDTALEKALAVIGERHTPKELNVSDTFYSRSVTVNLSVQSANINRAQKPSA